MTEIPQKVTWITADDSISVSIIPTSANIRKLKKFIEVLELEEPEQKQE